MHVDSVNLNRIPSLSLTTAESDDTIFELSSSYTMQKVKTS